ncbi:uncharacterized protein LOC111631639 [Centruroides sculpturatus]|uniref:uncharacterized protein LOC111631639 n=1 Tax=Centruroides sculpturatus TaxID=218467 RepID=UPI000C6E17D5|nr:uncharacterized protein LOC111631639 [Centruroides sculpturatus]
MHPQNVNQSFKSTTENSIFHCSVSGCMYADGMERYFTSKKLLKQHFTKVHAEKKYLCSKCQKGFGADWMRKRHEATCGTDWCCSCGNQYASWESLITHTRRTQHVMPPHFRHRQKKFKNTPPKQVFSPLVIIIQQPPIQIVPSVFSSSQTPIKHRKILPKCLSSAPKQFENTNSVNSSERTQSNDLCNIGTQTDPLFYDIGTWTSVCGTVFPEKISVSNTYMPSERNNQVSISASLFSENMSTERSTDQSIGKIQNKMAVETQTSGDDLKEQNIQRESRGSQCSGRALIQRSDIQIESTHTQTNESTVVKMKKASLKRIHGNNKNKKRSENKTGEMKNNYWSSLNTVLEDASVDKISWQAYLSRCSSSTQTSPRIKEKTVCDSETLTDQLSSSFWSEPENNFASTQSQEIYSYTSKIPETKSSDDVSTNEEISLNILSSFVEPFNQQSLSFPLEEISTNSVRQAISDNSQQLFNIETQTEFNKRLLDDVVQQSVQTDFYPLLSHTQTQTSEVDEFYSNVLANMETQTSEEFLFSDLEFSDIETQTPWNYLSCLEDDSESLSLNLDTGTDPFEFLKDGQNRISPTSAILSDMETQTNYQLNTIELTDSYAQTLDLNFSEDLFRS